MSALGAIFHRDGRPVDRRQLDRMRGALKMYGVDRDGISADGCMGLAWTHGVGFTPQDRLEYQPIALEGGQQIVFVGRLEHRGDLCAALGLPAARAADMADCELFRRAWLAWGKAVVEHVCGQYAFIVADPERRRLVAARSPLVGAPLYYYETHDRLVIASMPKGIFALGDVPRELNEQRLADALILNYEDKENSFFRHIRNLPLGRMLIAEPGKLAVTRYYDIRNTPLVRFRNDTDYVEAARSVLDAAVADAMRSVETPAIGLSSGLDSTTLAVTALDWLGRFGSADAKPLLGLTAVPEQGWDGRAFGAGRVGDESGPVRALMAMYPQLAVRFVDSSGIPIDQGLDQYQAASDMPLRNVLNLHWGQEISRQVRADGRRVQLTGSSGNRTISETGVVTVLGGLFRTGRWLRLARELRAYNRRRGVTRKFGLAGVMDLAAMPNSPEWLYAMYKRWKPGNFEVDFHTFSAIDPEYAREMRVEERIDELGWTATHQKTTDRRARVERRLERGSRHQSATASLGSATVSGVEHRDPLGERRLIEFCYAIPDDQYYRDGVDRRLVRRLMADRLPKEILKAPKGRQAADWHVRLKRDAARFDEELEMLEDDSDIARSIDLPRLRAALRSLPDRTPLTRSDHPDLAVVMFGLPRAIALARFVRSVKGRNR